MPEEKTLFLRNASGLVRSWRIWDGFIYAVYADSIIVAAALTYAIAYPWPQGNIPLAIVITTISIIPLTIVYAMLASAMPRVAGDYVWQTRSLNGFIGFTLSLAGLAFWPWFYGATNVYPGTVSAIAPAFSLLGGWLKSASLSNLGTYLTTADGIWWGFVVFVIWATFIMLVGMKWYARVQRISFYIGMAAVIVWVAVFLTTTNSQFITNFNSFVTSHFPGWGGSDPYHYIVNQAAAGGYTGYSLSQTTLSQTYLLVPVMAYVYLWVVWAGGLSGEIAGIQQLKKSLTMYVGSAVFAMIVGGGVILLTLLMVGNGWFSAANFLYYNPGSTPTMPFAPFLGFLFIAMTKNPALWAITIIGFNAWYWIWPTNNWVWSIRAFFAMSFDRALPSWLGQINNKTGVPINAIILVSAGSLVMGYLYSFTVVASFTLDATLGTALAIVGTTIAAIVLPYRKKTKALWEQSPAAKYKIGGVPVISICGILTFVILWIPLYYLWATNPLYGVNNLTSGAFVVSLFVISAAIYGIMKLYRKRENIDLNLVFGEIPAE